ncbi:hypothetical protein FQN50_008690 [Emmonsiellopsis sp. PD_5]|nr:hypothetical protein FQN50_008690 [Emmonsiellopsis sp. PD_5]
MVRIKLTVKVYSPGQTGRGDEQPAPIVFLLVVEEPEHVTLAELGCLIAEHWERLMSNFPKLDIKKIVEDDYPTVNLCATETVAETLLDSGKAARDPSDQRATVRVILKPGPAWPSRCRSVVQEWGSPGNDDVRSKRNKTKPPVPLFKPPVTHAESSARNGASRAGAASPPDRDDPLPSTERDAEEHSTVLVEDSQKGKAVSKRSRPVVHNAAPVPTGITGSSAPSRLNRRAPKDGIEGAIRDRIIEMAEARRTADQHSRSPAEKGSTIPGLFDKQNAINTTTGKKRPADSDDVFSIPSSGRESREATKPQPSKRGKLSRTETAVMERNLKDVLEASKGQPSNGNRIAVDPELCGMAAQDDDEVMIVDPPAVRRGTRRSSIRGPARASMNIQQNLAALAKGAPVAVVDSDIEILDQPPPTTSFVKKTPTPRKKAKTPAAETKASSSRTSAVATRDVKQSPKPSSAGKKKAATTPKESHHSTSVTKVSPNKPKLREPKTGPGLGQVGLGFSQSPAKIKQGDDKGNEATPKTGASSTPMLSRTRSQAQTNRGSLQVPEKDTPSANPAATPTPLRSSLKSSPSTGSNQRSVSLAEALKALRESATYLPNGQLKIGDNVYPPGITLEDVEMIMIGDDLKSKISAAMEQHMGVGYILCLHKVLDAEKAYHMARKGGSNSKISRLRKKRTKCRKELEGYPEHEANVDNNTKTHKADGAVGSNATPSDGNGHKYGESGPSFSENKSTSSEGIPFKRNAGSEIHYSSTSSGSRTTVKHLKQKKLDFSKSGLKRKRPNLPEKPEESENDDESESASESSKSETATKKQKPNTAKDQPMDKGKGRAVTESDSDSDSSESEESEPTPRGDPRKSKAAIPQTYRRPSTYIPTFAATAANIHRNKNYWSGDGASANDFGMQSSPTYRFGVDGSSADPFPTPVFTSLGQCPDPYSPATVNTLRSMVAAKNNGEFRLLDPHSGMDYDLLKLAGAYTRRRV